MTEFKIGDKVRVLVGPENSLYRHAFHVGDVGVVVGLNLEEIDAPAIVVEVRGRWQQIHPSELELVNE